MHQTDVEDKRMERSWKAYLVAIERKGDQEGHPQGDIRQVRGTKNSVTNVKYEDALD